MYEQQNYMHPLIDANNQIFVLFYGLLTILRDDLLDIIDMYFIVLISFWAY